MSSDDRALSQMMRSSEQLAHTITAVADLAKLRRSTGFIVPVVEADPDADDPTNLWLFADGQLNSRTPDGIIHRYQESTGAPFPVPTFATPPTFSSGHRIWFNGTTGAFQGYLNDGTLQTYSADVPAVSAAGGGPSTPGTTSTVAKPADPKKRSYTKTYSPNWVRTFCSRHGIEGGDEGSRYGALGSGYHGERRIMFGFPDGTMRSDMSGAKITAVAIKMRNTDSWSHGGIDIHFGLHSKDTAPGSFSQNRKNVYVGRWPESGWGGGADRWRGASRSIGERFRDDDARGMTIDQPAGKTFYGSCDRDSFELRISYIK